jgi:hypothetical protein
MMDSNCCTTRKLPIERLPSRQRELGRKAVEGQDARESKSAQARAEKAEAVIEDGRRKVRDLFHSSKSYSELREAMSRESKALRRLREPPGGLELDLNRANRNRLKKVNAALKKQGVQPEQLRGIIRASGEKLNEVLGGQRGTVQPGFNLANNLTEWKGLSVLHQYDLDWGERPPVVGPVEPSDWQIFGPEFAFWNLAFNTVHSDGFVVQRQQNLFEKFGFVGNIATMVLGDADDFDFAHAIADTEVVFIYEAPASGRLEVIVDALLTLGRHKLSIRNEWGWSEHWTHQRNYLSLNVFHPNVAERSLAEMSHFHRTGAGDDSWDEPALTPSDHYYGHMISNGAVQQGDTFFVGVGTRTFDITRANDVGVDSLSDFGWFIRSVEVRIVT